MLIGPQFLNTLCCRNKRHARGSVLVQPAKYVKAGCTPHEGLAGGCQVRIASALLCKRRQIRRREVEAMILACRERHSDQTGRCLRSFSGIRDMARACYRFATLPYDAAFVQTLQPTCGCDD